MIDTFCSTGQTWVLGTDLNYVRCLEQESKMYPKVALECAEVQTPTQENRQAAAAKRGGKEQRFCNFKAHVTSLDHYPSFSLLMLALRTQYFPQKARLNDCPANQAQQLLQEVKRRPNQM